MDFYLIILFILLALALLIALIIKNLFKQKPIQIGKI